MRSSIPDRGDLGELDKPRSTLISLHGFERSQASIVLIYLGDLSWSWRVDVVLLDTCSVCSRYVGEQASIRPATKKCASFFELVVPRGGCCSRLCCQETVVRRKANVARSLQGCGTGTIREGLLDECRKRIVN